MQSRFYDPAIARFINSDNPSYIGINGDFTSYNLFSYCGNSPVSRSDSGGQFWDTVLDLASIVADVIEIAVNPGSVMAWGALAADVASLVVPGLTGGGQLVRVVTSSDEVLDAAKYADDIFAGVKQFFSKSDVGQALHNAYDPILDAAEDSEKLLNKALTAYGSNLRPDGVDFTNRIIMYIMLCLFQSSLHLAICICFISFSIT